MGEGRLVYNTTLARLVWAGLAYQFDPVIASRLLEGSIGFRVSRGFVREVYRDDRLLLVRRPTDGFYSISLLAGEMIRASTKPPRFRVIVKGDRIIKGSVLARDVLHIDGRLKPGDEVIIVDEGDRLIGVGRLRVPPLMFNGLERGEIARVRKRVKTSG